MNEFELSFVRGAITALHKAADKARAEANLLVTELNDHGAPILVTTPESELAMRRARMWDECADDIGKELLAL